MDSKSLEVAPNLVCYALAVNGYGYRPWSVDEEKRMAFEQEQSTLEERGQGDLTEPCYSRQGRTAVIVCHPSLTTARSPVCCQVLHLRLRAFVSLVVAPSASGSNNDRSGTALHSEYIPSPRPSISISSFLSHGMIQLSMQTS